MIAVESAVLNGAQLVKALADSGAGTRTLDPARESLRLYHLKFGKVAPANEVLAALEAAGSPGPYERFRPVSEASLEKAQTLAERGAWVPPAARVETPIEQLLLAGAEKLPEPPAPKGVAEKLPGDRAEVAELPATALKPVQNKKTPPVAAE